MILVTGGAGFIGGNFVLDGQAQSGALVIHLGRLTYASNFDTPVSRKDDPCYQFLCTDIDAHELASFLLASHRYTIDTPKLEQELGRKPSGTFYRCICKIMQWHLDNQDGGNNVTSKTNRDGIAQQYGVAA